ncbi:MAG TPA: 50S ribosomal protein L29 [Chitinophagaceae bacterium]|nr:50S ribosomal protein L29 [Chitinophagaceae bacterium]
MPKESIDLKSLSEQDLKTRITESSQQLKRVRFSHAMTPVENPMTLRAQRRDIARLKTELRKRELGLG